MVGPGEVDEELEQETMDECQKYGKCLKCVIFEGSVSGFKPDNVHEWHLLESNSCLMFSGYRVCQFLVISNFCLQ